MKDRIKLQAYLITITSRRFKMSSATKLTASIDDLPSEMICELFRHLPPNDLIACSMVNKRWHLIYDAFKLHRLAALDYQPYYELILWHGSNQPIQETERCDLAMFVRLAEKPLLSNLRHLALSGYEFEYDLNKLNHLNRFRQLVHLEISISSLGGNLHLNLPGLKVLAFHYFNAYCALSIDCPKLHTLLYNNVVEIENLLEVKHPETVRVLETNLVDQELAPFKGVECLVPNFRAISQATLLSLPALRELRYNEDIENLVEIKFNFEIGTIDRVKRTLSEFVDEAKKLKGRDFRFTFSGFNMTNVNVNQIDFGVQVDEDEERVCNEYIYMKNYHLIEPGALKFIHKVDYTRLLSSVIGEFPRCFSQKFTGVESVRVHSVVEDADHFLWFLKSLKFLRRLELVNAGLSQEFYDQLPAVARSLVTLELRGDRKTELQLNFDFIGGLTCLSHLIIWQLLSLSSTTSLVRWLGGLKKASIHVMSGRELWIEKESSSPVWKVKVGEFNRGSLFETENPDELVSFFEGHVSRRVSD